MLKRVLLLSLSLLLVIAGVLTTIPTRQLTLAHTQLEKAQTEETEVTVLGEELLEKRIAGGQRHAYSIHLAHDQFLFVDVQQLGVDVIIELIDVDGKLCIETNAPDVTFGGEPFYWVAKNTGTYKVVIKPAQPSAKIGKYTIKIRELREAKDGDLHFVDGQNKLAEGEKLRVQGNKEDLEDAIACYNSAIEHWRKVGQVEREGVCVNSLGFVSYFLGDTQKALEYFEQAAKIRPETGGKAESLSDAASIYRILGQPEKALNLANQTIEITEKTGDKVIQSIALNTAGNIYTSFGNQEKALLRFERALELSRQVGSRVDEAISLQNMGTLFSNSIEVEKALVFFKEAIKIWDEVGDLRGKLEALIGAGSGYVYLREFDKALEYYDQVVFIASKIGQPKAKVSGLLETGYVFFLLGKNEKAMEYFQRGLDLSVTSNYKYGEAVALNKIGFVYTSSKDTEKALVYFNKAEEIAVLISEKRLEADIIYNKSVVYESLGQLEVALECIKKAVECSEKLVMNLSSQQAKTSFVARANPYYQIHIDMLMQLNDKEPAKGYNVEALHVYELSKARTLLDLLQQGHINIKEGIDSHLFDKEKELTQLVNKNTESLLKLLNTPTYSVEVKNKLEQQIHELDVELQQIQGKIRQANPRYVAIQKNRTLDLGRIQKEVLDDETILLEYALGQNASFLWAITNKSMNSYKLPGKQQIEKAANQALVYYKTFFRPENESAEDKRENDAKEQFLIKNAKEFSQILLGAVANQLANKRVLVVPDGILQYIPFAALPDPSKTSKEYYPLIVEHEVITIPSASTMGVLRSQFSERKPAPKSIMVLADPILTATDERLAVNNNKKRETLSKNFDKNLDKKTEQKNELSSTKRAFEGGDLVRLVAAGDEARNIGQIYKDATIALGSKASLPTATSSEVSDYRILHFATHGFFNSFQPELSGVVLSLFDENGNEQEGYLSANHIYNSRLNADLVVLSACQTGLGKDIRGEGILGLTRGFMYAGAERVMFTIWSVNDKSTSVLITKFYTALKEGSTPSLALRQAQISMWKDKKWSAPYYWAAFQIQGEWKTKR